MPLIEPIENKEVKRIKEFVIAIDTSGSVEGDEVQAFIEKTYNILKSTESFFGKINIHIIQCDAEIQEHVKITNQEEFDEYIKDLSSKIKEIETLSETASFSETVEVDFSTFVYFVGLFVSCILCILLI